MKNSKGQALIEFIIILPILLLIVMAIIDLGNIFSKKYSLENDLDIITDMYMAQDYISINNYIHDKNIFIEYQKEDGFVKINLNKIINVNTPILNNVLGKKYEIIASRYIYE